MKDLFESVPDYDMLIDGAFHGAANRIAVENPASGATIATVPAGTPAHAEAALGAARRAQPGWAARPAIERGRMVRAFADAVLAQKERLAVVVCAEQGKPIGQARGEIEA